jgi:hypothetical protein
MTKPTRETLLNILTYRRPDKSIGESLTIARFIDTIPGIKADRHGNRYKVIGKEPTTLFSAHTDTVHTIDGRQKLHVTDTEVSLNRNNLPPKRLKKIDKWFRNCLGADDAAGMYVLMCLIHARKPGLYIFHRAEECGAYGSQGIADDMDLFAKYPIERAIAFDRRGYNDVITHQSMHRCCSDEFAQALCDGLNLNMQPNPHGVFTDTANYVDIVPECTNVSVGYHFEHTDKEKLNLAFLDLLIERALAFDFDTLPTVRNPDNDAKTPCDVFVTKQRSDDDYFRQSIGDDWPDDDYGRPCYHSECRYLVRCLYQSDRKAQTSGICDDCGVTTTALQPHGTHHLCIYCYDDRVGAR